MDTFYCHDCDDSFEADIDNQWGTYEFNRCPVCGSGRTTLAVAVPDQT